MQNYYMYNKHTIRIHVFFLNQCPNYVSKLHFFLSTTNYKLTTMHILTIIKIGMIYMHLN